MRAKISDLGLAKLLKTGSKKSLTKSDKHRYCGLIIHDA